MAVSVTDILAGPFTPNGATTAFPFTFKAPSAAEVLAFVDLAGLRTYFSPGLYSVSLAPDDAEGGTLTFTVPPAGGLGDIYLELSPLFTQQATFDNNGFLPRTLNPNFDRSVLRDLWLRRETDRSIKVPLGTAAPELPATSSVQAVLGWQAGGGLGLMAAAGFKGDPGSNTESVGPSALLNTIAIPAGTDIIRTSGRDVAGDGFGATWKRVAVQPAHVGKKQDASLVWWEYVPLNVGARGPRWNIGHFINPDDAVTNNSTMIQSLIAAINATNGGELHHPGGTIVAAGVLFYKNTAFTGIGRGKSIFKRIPDGTSYIFKANAASEALNLHVEGLTLDVCTGTNTGGGAGTGDDFATGFQASCGDSTGYALNNITIRDVSCINSNKATTDDWTLTGIAIQGCTGVTLNNVYSDGCQIKLNGTSQTAKQIVVDGLWSTDARAYGISVVMDDNGHMDGVYLSNLTIVNPARGGIYLGQDNAAGTTSNNVVVRNAYIAMGSNPLHGGDAANFALKWAGAAFEGRTVLENVHIYCDPAATKGTSLGFTVASGGTGAHVVLDKCHFEGKAGTYAISCNSSGDRARIALLNSSALAGNHRGVLIQNYTEAVVKNLRQSGYDRYGGTAVPVGKARLDFTTTSLGRSMRIEVDGVISNDCLLTSSEAPIQFTTATSYRLTVAGVVKVPAVNDTYVAGAVTYTVAATSISGGAGYLQLTGASAPAASGTLAAAAVAYVFTVAGVVIAPTVGATYTVGGHTYTITGVGVVGTGAAGSGAGTITATSDAAAGASGVLAKASGTGDAAIVFSASTGGDASIAYSASSGALGKISGHVRRHSITFSGSMTASKAVSENAVDVASNLDVIYKDCDWDALGTGIGLVFGLKQSVAQFKDCTGVLSRLSSVTTGATDASGFLTITHNFGTTSVAGGGTVVGADYVAGNKSSATTTSFKLKIIDPIANVAVASTSVTVNWWAEAI